jgi:hypothetical protein
VRLALPAGELARIVVALHDGVVITQIPEEVPDDPGSSPLERTALLLLLSAAARSTD